MSEAEIIAALKALAEKWTRDGRTEQFGAIGSTKMACADELRSILKGVAVDDKKARRAKTEPHA